MFYKFPKPPLNRQDYERLTSKQRVDEAISYSKQVSEGSDKLQADAAVEWLCTEIAELAPLLKNEGFYEEAEWRIAIKGAREQVKFRASSSFLVPYVELKVLSDVACSALREVIIGPNPNQRRCEKSIKMLLTSCGLSEVEVKSSSLPFNSW
ncbi:hypothetical protein [Nitrosomonas sp. Nm166]|uniref:hypothetical protein n=1 Tax=Nitrosomonas sp. Nm166 TaxID=1881054 RepID=UPI0008EA8BD2|nr:hypothetical protein [Nitrosomonas sp. Nm166]SFF25053.1 hypothetical protein SAMN05428977_10864 [Nitrosomonas sp. Nm166]